MRKALLLIDLQRDFLNEPMLIPPASTLTACVASLLARCRAAAIPVIHIRTVVRTDGSNQMPHWRRCNDTRCIEGTPGAMPPEILEALPGEAVFEKTFYSAFTNQALDGHLRREGIKTLLIAGVHTQSCVQATVLDAYQLGYDVKLVTDAVASYSPLHADLTIRHLKGRACGTVSARDLFVDAISARQPAVQDDENCKTHPVAYIDGQWIVASGQRLWDMRDPCLWERRMGQVPLAGAREIRRATALSRVVQPDWAGRGGEERLALLRSWAEGLERLQDQCVDFIIREVGKPRTEAEAEFDYAIRLLRACFEKDTGNTVECVADDIRVLYRPRGVIAVITPWNNPLSLPVGKLAPALMWGNAVVWKPALQSPGLARLLIETLVDAGLPANCINVLFGDADTARALLACPEIDAVSFTGSEASGREISVMCSVRGIPLQAELGGNNPALIAEDADISKAAVELAHAVFSFSGQRCTAPRRLIVVEQIFESFSESLVEAVRTLKIGSPEAPDTHLGPLISRDRQKLMGQWIRSSMDQGAHLLTGGKVPAAFTHGCWFEPTILTGLPSESFLVLEETFAPLGLLLKARSFDDGIELCNEVRHGLRAICYAESEVTLNRFVQSVHAGVIHLNESATRISTNAPFLGWKSSGLGLPEHGRWDRDFYTRVQAVYGKH